MLTYPKIDPVALQIGPLAVHWYGLTYLAAFGLFMLLAHRRLRHEPFASIEGPGSPCPTDLLRLSVGLEDAEDLYADLDRALRAAND